MIGTEDRDGVGAKTAIRRRRWAFWRRLRGERGATMIEFAIVLVPFFLLLFGTIEVGLILWGTYELENATEDASRRIRTGQVQLNGIDENGFKTLICDRVSLLFDCQSKVQVEVRNFAGFDEIAGNPPDPLDGDGSLKSNFAFNPGGPRAIVLVNTFYQWPLINPLSEASMSNMGGGDRLLQALSAFRNEAWPN